jgi:15-cis-phytoene desaturase
MKTAKFQVIVVGGGLAGLTSAVALSDTGLNVLVLERSSMLGGRATSWTDSTTGDPVHIGPHIFLNTYPNLLRLLDRLGTRDRIVWQDPTRFITFARGERTHVMRQFRRLPPPMPFLPSVMLDGSLSMKDKLSNFPVTFHVMRMTEQDIEALDDVPASTFLREMGVTEKYIESFWAFVCMAIMNCPLDRCSTAALMRFYRYLIGKQNLQVGFADGGLAELYADQARTIIERAGGLVETGARVVGFLGDAQRACGVELADGRRIEAPFVLSAVPGQALHAIARPEWKQHHPMFDTLLRFEPCPYISSYFWFDRKITRHQFWARPFSPHDFNCDFYDLSNIHRGWEKRPSVITSNIIYSERVGAMSDAEIIDATRREIAEFLPIALRANVVHAVVNRVPMAVHCPYPGTERLRPVAQSPVRGLWLAGDWTRTGFTSSMEGACASGWIAAEAILRARGDERRMAISHGAPEGFVGLIDRLPARWRARRPAAPVQPELSAAAQ